MCSAADTTATPEPPTVLISWLYRTLTAEYGVPEWCPDGDAIGGLVATILSQHTSDINSEKAYRQLRERFPTWEQIRDAPAEALADAIRSGGLAHVKAERIRGVLRALSARSIHVSLDVNNLATLEVTEARARLTALPGVGNKTASCVLLFSLGMPAFPVDTHVLRITHRLGLLSSHINADAAHETLERLIPPTWRHTIHINLIRHGRRVCHAQRPKCPTCVLRAKCPYFWTNVADQAASGML